MSINYLHTLGDSTIDNLYWLLDENGSNLKEAKATSVEGLLKKKLETSEYQVVSHAYDGFTTRSLLDGDTVGAVLSTGGGRGQAYLKEKSGGIQKVISPLEELKKKVESDLGATHKVVLSVGGNDFRVNLSDPWRLLKDIPAIQKRYLNIVSKLKELNGGKVQPILMFQYRTDASNDPYKIYPLLGAMGSVAMLVHAACLVSIVVPAAWVLASKVTALSAGIYMALGAVGLHFSHKVVPLSAVKDIAMGKKIGVVMLGVLLQAFYSPIIE